MREIKFRAWNKFRKRMVIVINIDLHDMVVTFSDETVGGLPATTTQLCQDFPIMQYTGLKDKNGKEIYDGDILTDGIEVIWFNDFSTFALIKRGWMYPHYFGEGVNAKDIEIIGNKFENPELLTGKVKGGLAEA